MDAIAASFVRITTMADGTPRVVLDLDCPLSEAAKLFGAPGAAVAIARLTPAAAQESAQAATVERASPYGKQAAALYRCGFFSAPAVRRAIGTDAEFLAWLRRQPCAVCKRPAPSEAAHVRRIAAGAGVGIKPEYSAIPLCHEHHESQHQRGESSIGGKEAVDRMAADAVTKWAHAALIARLGYEHLSDIPPETLRAWAEHNELHAYLPKKEYRA